ncbi:MAG: ATP-binding protein [Candidatus Sericytochromatia bacterium]|nr:ATP-binding protein [Candidatus Sericytochromatia bacterium]
MSHDDVHAIRLNSSLDHVGVARDFVAEIAKAVPMTAREVYDLELVVDEAVTNVIEHGYAGRDDASVEIAVALDDGHFTILITHDGLAFDPASHPDVDLKAYITERRVGGLGLFLMKKLLDEVEYSTAADGRRQIRMMKKRQTNPLAPDDGRPS